MSDKEVCEHITSGQAPYFMRITRRATGVQWDVCRECFAEFLAMNGRDPHKFPVGFNVYRSGDPKLPLDKWERLTDKPFRGETFKVDPPPLGVNHYYYTRPVNVYGEEGEPSELTQSGRGGWELPLASEHEM